MTRFQKLISEIPEIGRSYHVQTILDNTRNNSAVIAGERSIRDIAPDGRPCLVVSAGPSLHRAKSLSRIKPGPELCIVAADGAYIACLKAGIKPDYVVSIDPHPTRIVRWFGERVDDEYFQRQDLDISIREEEENKAIVDANRVPLIIASSAPENLVERTKDFDRYWFAPLIDDPETKESITSILCLESRSPAFNTGGTVGNAAIIFAKYILGSCSVSGVGLDYGYPDGTPLKNTQEYNLLKDEKNFEDFYPYEEGPWGVAFTSPTYYFYRQALLDLLDGDELVNCTEGGLLSGPNIKCCSLEEWQNGWT